jgi:hypothetical protein
VVSKIVTTDKGQNIGMKSLIVFISLLMGIATSSFALEAKFIEVAISLEDTSVRDDDLACHACIAASV